MLPDNLLSLKLMSFILERFPNSLGIAPLKFPAIIKLLNLERLPSEDGMLPVNKGLDKSRTSKLLRLTKDDGIEPDILELNRKYCRLERFPMDSGIVPVKLPVKVTDVRLLRFPKVPGMLPVKSVP